MRVHTPKVLVWTPLCLIIFMPCLCKAQILGFFPSTDSISLRGSCTPPALTCRVVNAADGVDTIEFSSAWGDPMYAGSPEGSRIGRCYFLVLDSTGANKYQVGVQRIGMGPSDYHRLTPDTTFYLMGRYDIRLLVSMGIAPTDSMQVRFRADATGGVERLTEKGPDEVVLMPNFPNPFNPSTTISYELRSASNVDLRVYDILGRDIITLVQGVELPGVHSVVFSPINISSGTMFCRLQAGLRIRSMRISLIR
jgi:hypothetical protein